MDNRVHGQCRGAYARLCSFIRIREQRDKVAVEGGPQHLLPLPFVALNRGPSSTLVRLADSPLSDRRSDVPVERFESWVM